MKILVAESNKPLREEVATTLTDVGYKVVVAADGQGVENHFLSVDAPHLFIADATLPGFDLSEFLNKSQKQSSYERPYILLLTESGTCPRFVDDCLTKPFHIDLLLSRVFIGKRVVELQKNIADFANEAAKAARVSSTDQDSLFYLLDSLDALVYASDLETHELLFMNAGAQDVYCGQVGDDCRKIMDSDRTEPSPHSMKEKLLDSEGSPCGPDVWEFRHIETGAWYQCRDQAIHWLDGRLVHLSIATSITDRVRAEEVLRTSEKGLRAVHDAAFEAVFLAEKGICLSQNLAAKKMFGYTLEEAVGKPSVEWVIPDDRERLTRNMYVGFELPYEVTALRKDGSTFPAEIQARMIMYQGRQVRMTAMRDITDRKKAAEIALSHERRFKEFFDSINDAIFVHPLQDEGSENIVEVNETACKKYGYTREEFLQMTVRDITLNLAIGENTKEENRRKLLEDQRIVFETVHISKAGKTFPVEINTNIVERFGKKVIFSVVRDITERKKAEEQVREQERRIEDFFRSVNDAIIVYPYSEEANEKVVEVNDSACELYGYSRDEFMQLCPRKLLPERILNEYLESGLRQKLLDEKHLVFEILSVKKSGEEFPIEVSANIVEQSGQLMLLVVARDITERKKAEELVREQERRFENFFRSISDAIFVRPFSEAGHAQFVEVNEAACQMYGFTREEFLKMAPDDIDQLVQMKNSDRKKIKAELLKQKRWFFESTHIRKSGETFPVEINSSVIEQFGQRSIISVVRDISKRKKAEELTRAHEKRFEDFFSSLDDAIFVYPAQEEGFGYFIEANETACRNYGYTLDEFRQMSPKDITPTELFEKIISTKTRRDLLKKKHLVFESVHIRKSGEEFPVEINSRVVERFGQEVILSVARDITERKKAEEKIERMAFYDALTDLPNRSLFLEQLRQEVQTYKREKNPFALLMIDLDHFKDVNDSLGHPIGDLLLKAVAQRISAVVRSSDVFARFGGDEFVLLQSHYNDLTDVTDLAEKVITEVSRDFEIEGHTVWINCSIGIATNSKPEATVDELLSRVDSALYKAKETGRGTYAFYEDAMTLSLQRELELTQELAKAIGGDELFVEYQPQIDLADGSLVGVEALVRWDHPTHGVLMPGSFISIAEKRGLIRDLSNWVMKEAFQQSAVWTEAGLPFGRIAINLCAQQLSHRNFEDDVRAALTEIGADPSTLEFEFTETVLIDAAEKTMESISNLSKLGIGFAIDDFGTGFSSLSYLRKLHTDKIKIDREFVRDILVDPGAEKIISATIALGKTLGLVTIAEGVENLEQAESLKKHGCDFAQGFHYDKSLLPDKLEELWLGNKRLSNSSDR